MILVSIQLVSLDIIHIILRLTYKNLCFILEKHIFYISIVGETAQKLVQLNIGKTFVTNVGIQNLCFGDDFGQYGKYTYRCPNLVILIVSETRVTGEGMYQITVDVQVRRKY